MTNPSVVSWARWAIDAMCALHRDNPRLHRVLFEEAPWPADLLEHFRQAEAAAIATVQSLIREDATCQPSDPGWLLAPVTDPAR